MAHNLDDPEFWLPPLFLTDDDFKKTDFPLSDSNSGFSSPVDSSMGSESDEDGFLTELTRRLTSSTHLSHDLWKPKPNHGHVQKTDTIWKVPRSPQSSENVAEITRLDQNTSSDYSHFWGPPQKQWLNSVAKNDSYHSNQPNLYKPHQQNGNSNGLAPGLSPSAWPSLQQSQSQSHKQTIPVPWIARAGVVSNSMTNRGCSGTGVFFPCPRGPATPTQTHRRKHPVALKQRNASAKSHQRREMSWSQAAAATKNEELRLPQEWTY